MTLWEALEALALDPVVSPVEARFDFSVSNFAVVTIESGNTIMMNLNDKFEVESFKFGSNVWFSEEVEDEVRSAVVDALSGIRETQLT